MYEESVWDEIELFVTVMDLLLQDTDRSSLPLGDYDLVLELKPTEDGPNQWHYYFVDHDSRALFWLHDFDATELVAEVTSISSDSPKFSLSQDSPFPSLYTILTYSSHM